MKKQEIGMSSAPDLLADNAIESEPFLENTKLKFLIPKSSVSLKNKMLGAFMSYFINPNKYLALELITAGAIKDGSRIDFSENLTNNEYFQVVWNSENMASFKLWTNKCIYVNSRDNKLYCDGDNWKATECAFLIKLNPIQLNESQFNITIPMPSLSKSKSKEFCKFLTYRSKPGHCEATALMIDQCETIASSVKKSDNSGLTVNIITANERYFSGNSDGTINFLAQENRPHCWWEIFFLSKQDICIRPYRWRTLFQRIAF